MTTGRREFKPLPAVAAQPDAVPTNRAATTGSGPQQKGGALLTVLWVSAALAAIAFSVATTVRGEISRVSGSADGLRAYYLATGSVERAIQWMLWGPDNTDFWQPNKPRLLFNYPSGDVVVEMIPESAKLNINTASQDDLVRLAAAVTGNVMQANEIASGIVEYREGRAFGTLAAFGPGVGASSFQPHGASFQEIEELLLVRGMTPEFYYGNYVSDGQGHLTPSGGLRDCLSVWGSSGPFDANTMSPALMQAVGVSAQGALEIAKRRQLAPFQNLGEVSDAGGAAPRMIIGGGHVIWSIRATARLRGKDGAPSDVVRSASAVVKLLDPKIYPMMPMWVIRWYDDGWSQFQVTPPGAATTGSGFNSLGVAQ